MRLVSHTDMGFLTLTSLCLVLCTLFGCAIVGPSSISMGRANYNEAINKTEDEQMLLSIVKGRYGETFSLLVVGSVTASILFSASIGANVGIGSQENYSGNLVPLSVRVVYEENPTISYSPVQSEKYLRYFLSPVPLETLTLILHGSIDPAMYFNLLVYRINDIQNQDFLDPPFAKTDYRFQRIVELYSELYQAGIIYWLANPKENKSIEILITGYAPNYSEKVGEYLRLLGLPMPKDVSEDILIPVYFAVKGRENGISISTRSTFNLIEILRATVEIPQEQADIGLARNYPKPGLAGKDIHIYSSKDKPTHATVAVRHHGYWFYIDDTDIHTKLFYNLVRMLWSANIASATDQLATPVLTIPVSR